MVYSLLLMLRLLRPFGPVGKARRFVSDRCASSWLIKPTLNCSMLVLQYSVLRLMLSPSRLKMKRAQGSVFFIIKIGGWSVSKYVDIE